MALRGGVVVPISADVSGLTRGLRGAQGRLRTFGKLAAIAAGAAGIGAMVKTLQIGTAEFMEQQKVAAQTGAVLKSTGGIANVTAKQIGSLSTALMKKSGVDDEAIASGQNLLLTFTKIRNETGKGNDIFDQATVAMLDLSVAMGKDLNSSAILVGKALNDPVKGATALSRAGVQLTKGQKDQIEAFVESGRVLEAQKIILGELTTQFGGSAEAAGKTLPGQLNILKQTFNNLAGELAATFLPGVARAATALVDFLRQFGKAPTLEAKIKLVVGAIGDVAWRGISSLYEWWTKQGRAELPARVILTPSGKMQFDAFFKDIEARARRFGENAGRRFAQFFIDLLSSDGRKRSGDAIRSIGEGLLEAGKFVFRISGTTLLSELIIGFTTGAVDLFTSALTGIFQRVSEKITEPVRDLGEKAKDTFNKAIRRGGKDGFANVMTQTVRDAVQAARGTLAGMAGSLGGMVSDIIGGTSPEAKRAREIRAQQKRELAQREETRLRNAIAEAETDDERKAAEQDLQDFLLEAEAQRLEESVQQQQTAANESIANLTESFNRGEISAEQFSNALNGIIGANRGAELGKAFAGAFERELQGIINVAKDIASVVGQAQPITAVSGGGVGEALKSENERRFNEAFKAWESRRKTRREQAENFRKRPGSAGGATITAEEAKEIKEIMAAWDRENPKPVRSAYGLALGGILKQPTFVAGEAGKEAVIPLESGSAMRILRDAIGGGGGSTQVINLTVNAGLGTNPDELSQVIVNSIKRYEKRNGSVFQGPLVSVAANVSGATSTDSGATTFNRIRSLRSG
jgi:hypothetical protein